MSIANQAQQPVPNEELSGWKKIAEHLGVSERTVRNWEKERALPVRRRGTIAVALLSELEQWKRESLTLRTASGAQPTPQSAAPSTSHRVLFAAITLGAFIVIAIGYWLYRTAAIEKGRPAEVAVRGKSLIVSNDKGQELWRHSFPDALHQESYFPAALPKFTWIGDLDGDGKLEVLAVFTSVNNLVVGTPLICFSQDGKVKWQFSAGRQLRVGDHVLTGIYFSDITVLPERRQIIVKSNHSMSYPQQIALLDSSGKVLGEYWHSGHLRDLVVADLAGTGEKELLMPGINNDLGQATLVVLPLKNMPPPISTSQSDLQALASRGGERAVVLFPKSCITKKLEPSNRAFRARVTPGGIEVDVYESYTERGTPPLLSYTLDKDFRVIGLLVSSTFLSRHKQLEAEGKLDHSFSQAESDQLKREVVVKRFP